MFRLARLSLANRAIIALASLAIIAFGVFATFTTKQELIPSLSLPTVSITTAYPGASPEIVEREVTEKVESAISGVDGLESRVSTSSNGVSVIQAEFNYDTDTKDAARDLTEAINRIQSDLPDDVDPQVQSGNTDDLPVLLIAASADVDERTLAQRLDERVVPELRGLEGVREVQVTGAREERVLITLDDEKLAKNGLTQDAVTQALQANGVSIPGGNLTTEGKTRSVEVGESFDSVDDLLDLTLVGQAQQPQQPGQQPGQAKPKVVQLSDVATVEDQLEPASSITRTDGKQSLGLMVTKTSEANTVDVAHAVKDDLGDLEEKIGGGAALTVAFDQAPFIEESIEGLATEGGIGLVMAVLVILVFLLSFRSTIVTALSIPFSLLFAVGGLYVGGYSFNILTLGALTVAVGRVVDDSIVVLENIKRHLAYGEKKKHAILAGVKEVAGAITASTLTTVGVFLPVAIVGGQVGELFRPFGVTVTIALLASLLVSLTIIPVLAYWFLKPVKISKEDQERVEAAAVEKERRNPLQRVYVPIIKWTTRHKVTTLGAGLLVFAATVAAVPLVQTNFLGSMGGNSYQVTQTMPVATSLGETDEAAKKVEAVLDDLDDVETYQATVGNGGDFGGFGPAGGTNTATFYVTSDEAADQEAFEDRLRDRLDDLTGVGELEVGAADSGGGSTDLEVLVKASNDDDLRTATERVEAAVRDTPDTTDVTSNLATDLPTVQVDVDREKAARKGLSEAQIGQAVRQAFEGEETTTVILGGEARDVLLRGSKAPGTVAAIRDFEVASPTGGTVQVGDVATVREVERAAEITRTDGEQTATVTATPEGENTGAVSTAMQERLDDVDMPEGASWELGGVSEEQDEAFQQLLLALVAAIAIVFMVMVATFRSLIQPLILLVSIPFAATGAIGLLLATGIPLGVPGMIGMLMLVGIVVTNAIVLIDLINQYRAAGMSVRDAVVEGGRRRLRPILMTALATIFALMPMAFGLTGGGVFISQPLAIVVIGGLVTSTLLTLVLVPTLYSMVEGAKERGKERKLARKHKKHAHVDDAGPSMADLAPAQEQPVPVGGESAAEAPVPARHAVTVQTPLPGGAGADDDGAVSVGVLQVEVLVRHMRDGNGNGKPPAEEG